MVAVVDVTNHNNIKLLPDSRSCGKEQNTGKIMGGVDAGLGQFPWMVAFVYKYLGNAIYIYLQPVLSFTFRTFLVSITQSEIVLGRRYINKKFSFCIQSQHFYFITKHLYVKTILTTDFAFCIMLYGTKMGVFDLNVFISSLEI